MNRRVEVKSGDRWVVISMKHLTPGDVFRLFEPHNGNQVVCEGSVEFRATSQPYYDDNSSVITIMCDPL